MPKIGFAHTGVSECAHPFPKMKRLQVLIDFMGDESVWRTMVPGVIIKRRHDLRPYIPTSPVAYFVDSHWRSRKAYSDQLFDSYAHYQKPGTHRFCQTFAMMHLLDQLPPPVSTYMEYDRCALNFIRSVIDHLPCDHPGFDVDSKERLLAIHLHVHVHIHQNPHD